MMSNKPTTPEGKYRQNMDPTASWWQAMMDAMPSMSWDASSAPCGAGGDEDKDVEKEDAANKNKQSLAKRQSTCSTVLEDFSFHGGDGVGRGTAPSRLGCQGRLKLFTSPPSFRKRFGICIGITLLFVIALVSVLAFNLSSSSGGQGAVPAAAAGTDVNVSHTGGGGADADRVSDADGGADGNATDDAGNFGNDNGSGGGTTTTSAVSIDLTSPASPFSTLHPVDDMGMFGVVHTRLPPESLVRGSGQTAVPTNAWYENLLLADGEPTNMNKAYVVPHLVDAVGPIPGLRVHANHLTATSTTVQVEIVEMHGLTLGAFSSSGISNSYSVVSTNPLGLTLKWDALPMTSSIIRGMPYASMHYPKPLSRSIRPTIASEILLEPNGVVADGAVDDCANVSRVESELKLTFVSDFTWMVFFSEPVFVQCLENTNGTVEFQVVGLQDDQTSLDQLTIRAALLTNCTSGNNAIYCSDQQAPTEQYEQLLRERAHLYPGPNADIRYGVDGEKAVLRIDWDVQSTYNNNETESDDADLITYALPHHLEHTDSAMQKGFCTSSLFGSTCVVSGSVWDLEHDLPVTSFRAPRPPSPKALSQISGALMRDIVYVIPDNFQRGAGDTYFSGKILARVARVLLIAEELNDLCNGKARGYDLTEEESQVYEEACRNITLPSDDDIKASLAILRSSVEVWINGTAEARFAYDSGWGGVISCGCVWNGDGCSNALPDCPATSDQGLNFGNGFYNDHHFHYGYHIYAAAAVAHFDGDWGRTHFEEVLLLIRDVANPSSDDAFFPKFRHKDWYQGSSWASGVTQPTFANGMNQESSSEAIAAYEAVALFGQEMMLAWNDVSESSKVEVSKSIHDAGVVLASTEVRSVDYYWHVRQKDESRTIYPSTYKAGVIGILWSTMAQFTTWFGNAPYLMYGIQLLPLTPISESRDASQEWLREMYAPLATSCAADSGCTSHGWSILQLAILATIGNVDMAMENAKQIPASAFNSAGGNGHSMTNTLHYMATRPEVEPADVSALDFQASQPNTSSLEDNAFLQVDCGIPDSCTSAVLDTLAGGYTCRERILWLMNVEKMTEGAACSHVAVTEYPTKCSACANPSVRA